MIKFDHVYKQYNPDFFVLYDANFSITKSTLFIGDDYLGTGALLRLMSKIDKNYNGEIFIDNINIKHLKNKDLSLAFIPNNPVFIGNNLINNLYYPLKIRKINKNIAKNIINNEINHYKLNNFNKNIKYLSLSEKKIIALLRAKIRQPRFVLLEDFFSNLDQKYLDIAKNILADINKESIIIATQNAENKIFKELNLETIKLEKD